MWELNYIESVFGKYTLSQIQSLNHKIMDEFKSKFNQEAKKYGCEIDNIEITPLDVENAGELKNTNTMKDYYDRHAVLDYRLFKK